MLEDVAVQYVFQSEEDLRIIGFGLTVVGAVIAGLRNKSSDELRRAPYFAYTALLFFVASVSQLVWLGSIPAMTGGYLWAFMLVDVVVWLTVGYAVGVIALARSRDAYGHGGMAFLAFIPLGNFWLLLTGSKNAASPNNTPTIPLLSGAVGVVTGFALLISGVALSAFIQTETERLAVLAQDDPALQEVGLDMMLQSSGVEATLQEVAMSMPTPSKVDEITTIVQVAAEGRELIYIYELASSATSLPEAMRTNLSDQNCNYAPLRPLFDAGATLVHIYRGLDGIEIGTIKVDRAACGF
jgi:uncharacterized membrane protein